MKIAILGGTFNPVHIGHIFLAECVLRQFFYDKVIFVPSVLPPHKNQDFLLDSIHRVKMLRLALKDNENFEIETCEIERGGISYTFDTLQFLKKKYGSLLQGKIGVILGSDLAKKFSLWKNAQKIALECDLILANRSEKLFFAEKSFAEKESEKFATAETKTNKKFQTQFPFPHKKLENHELDISSSAIRCAIAKNGAWRYLVHPAVFEYIIREKLYGFEKNN